MKFFVVTLLLQSAPTWAVNLGTSAQSTCRDLLASLMSSNSRVESVNVDVTSNTLVRIERNLIERVNRAKAAGQNDEALRLVREHINYLTNLLKDYSRSDVWASYISRMSFIDNANDLYGNDMSMGRPRLQTMGRENAAKTLQELVEKIQQQLNLFQGVRDDLAVTTLSKEGLTPEALKSAELAIITKIKDAKDASERELAQKIMLAHVEFLEDLQIDFHVALARAEHADRMAALDHANEILGDSPRFDKRRHLAQTAMSRFLEHSERLNLEVKGQLVRFHRIIRLSQAN